jgi:hypothetical protein
MTLLVKESCLQYILRENIGYKPEHTVQNTTSDYTSVLHMWNYKNKSIEVVKPRRMGR